MPITISGDSPNFSSAEFTTASVTTLNAPSGVLATQNGMTGIAKAWVNFQGGNGNTSGTINGSYNVSSVTANATGSWTVNITTALPNANYSVQTAVNYSSSHNQNALSFYGTKTTTAINVYCVVAANAASLSCSNYSVAVFS